MQNKEVLAIYQLLGLKRVGPVLTNKILNNVSATNKSLHETIGKDLDFLNKWLNQNQIKTLSKENLSLKNLIEMSEKNNIKFLTISDTQYPKQLLSGLQSNAPPVLTCLGNLDLLNMKMIGFCGSRKASEKGLQVAADCSEQLVKNNIVVVSGHAAGIDQKAHYSALNSSGSTIIILPEGISNFKIRKSLKDVWDWNRTLVISEFLPDAKWTASRAMQRNKTIVGLSDAMILIEAGKRGGSMDAGRATLAMNKTLYTPIYEGMPEFAIGNDILLKSGASAIRKKRSSGKANLIKILNVLNNGHLKKELFTKQLSLL